MSGALELPQARAGGRRLRILHVLRAPLGGLFRHVVDLTRAQIARGHEVGVFCDAATGGAQADATLRELAPHLALGVTRAPMRRNPSLTDVAALRDIVRVLRARAPDVVHGHGSKGGAYARLPRLLQLHTGPVVAYTPHGGSFNYQPGSLTHRGYMRVEAMLAGATDVLLFESAFIRQAFARYVGATGALVRIVRNGIAVSEFEPIAAAPRGAPEFFYLGELRSAKGIDTLIDALARLEERAGIAARLVLVGSGPDQAALSARAERHGLLARISFVGPLPAREAFMRGHVMVVPSRAESLPYVVIEAAAAQKPMIATNVGGIGEIFGPFADRLIAADDPGGLAQAMIDTLARDDLARTSDAAELARFVASQFTVDLMVDNVLEGYAAACAARHGHGAMQRAIAAE